jgi:hypothetical protein
LLAGPFKAAAHEDYDVWRVSDVTRRNDTRGNNSAPRRRLLRAPQQRRSPPPPPPPARGLRPAGLPPPHVSLHLIAERMLPSG